MQIRQIRALALVSSIHISTVLFCHISVMITSRSHLCHRRLRTWLLLGWFSCSLVPSSFSKTANNLRMSATCPYSSVRAHVKTWQTNESYCIEARIRGHPSQSSQKLKPGETEREAGGGHSTSDAPLMHMGATPIRSSSSTMGLRTQRGDDSRRTGDNRSCGFLFRTAWKDTALSE